MPTQVIESCYVCYAPIKDPTEQNLYPMKDRKVIVCNDCLNVCPLGLNRESWCSKCKWAKMDKCNYPGGLEIPEVKKEN